MIIYFIANLQKIDIIKLEHEALKTSRRGLNPMKGRCIMIKKVSGKAMPTCKCKGSC
jgi:hypothetical protein